MTTTFTIPGEPRQWQRAGGNGKRRFTPKAMQVAKDAVGMCARVAFAEPYHYDIPLVVEYDFYLKPPKVINYTKRPYPLKTPDIDNLEKLVSDAMNDIAYHDDRQIVESITRKRWARDGKPRTEVTVRVKEVGNGEAE